MNGPAADEEETCPLFMTRPPKNNAANSALDALAAIIDEDEKPATQAAQGTLTRRPKRSLGEVQVTMALTSVCGDVDEEETRRQRQRTDEPSAKRPAVRSSPAKVSVFPHAENGTRAL